MKTLTVALGDAAYEIRIGANLLHQAGTLAAAVMKRPSAFIVTDDTVAPLYLDALSEALEAAGIAHGRHVVATGEGSKSFATLERLIDALLEARVDRSTTLIALGGGVVGDLTGFAAAITLRGVDFIQIPTTLLAQVDSSVGGKTGVNTRYGKNLVGAFHQPRLVISDTHVLETLPARERRSGYAEILKMAMIGDASFFDWLETNAPLVIGAEETAVGHAVAVACAEKARIVAADEREGGVRALLNFGHTFGHALEAELQYSEVLRHGEAVALGMLMATDLSVRLGECPETDLDRLRAHLDRVGLVTRLSALGGVDWAADRLLAHMDHDKKAIGGKITFVLVRGIGHGFLRRDVDPTVVRAVIDRAVAA